MTRQCLCFKRRLTFVEHDFIVLILGHFENVPRDIT